MSKGSWIKDPRTGLKRSQIELLDDKYFTASGSLDYSQLGSFELYEADIPKYVGFRDHHNFMNVILPAAVARGLIHVEEMWLDTVTPKKIRMLATQISSAEAGGRYYRQYQTQERLRRVTQVSSLTIL